VVFKIFHNLIENCLVLISESEKKVDRNSTIKKEGEAVMKSRIVIGILVLTTLLFTNFTYAEVNKSNSESAKYAVAEENRLIGLASDNEGLRISCAFNLGEMKSKNAVFPLMKLLRESESVTERIIAALSLVKIGDPQGVYMVGRVAKFSDCEKTKYFCEKFYQSFQNHQRTGEKIPTYSDLAML
jgi:hypothetical protein